jgi:hypothetical protein
VAIANYTTKIAARRSVQEIQDMLARQGAQGVLTEFEGGKPTALSFRIQVAHGQVVAFRLPSNTPGVLAAMRGDKSIPKQYLNPEQAERVAWRITRDWVRAQLAIIEAGLARLDQVMLPYAVTPTGETLGELFERRGGHLLALEFGDAD